MPIANTTKRDHTKLICDLGELSGLFKDAQRLETFLQTTVEMIANHMHSDVCSIYLYYADREELVLKATIGLNAQYIDKIKLKLGEGLTGMALKELRPICERNASQNPSSRYFSGLGEEKFESFLAVPIIRGTTRIGALVIQNTKRNYFTEEDVAVMRAISSQLANTIEMTQLILSFEEKRPETASVVHPQKLKFIKGKSGAPGFAYSSVFIFKDAKNLTANLEKEPSRKLTLKNFHDAVKQTESQLESLQQEIEEKLVDVASLIFTAQVLMLKDNAFIEAIVALIEKGTDPARAVVGVVNSYVQKFDQITNPYLQERRQDILDVGQRLLDNLFEKDGGAQDFANHIIIAHGLYPSDMLKLSSQNVKGIILLSGGVTSHVSILARSLQIPLIIADVPDLLALDPAAKILMDAEQGNIYVNPEPNILASFKAREDAAHMLARLKEEVRAETYTKDKTRIHLLSNINLLGDIRFAQDFKAEGIGLYRTEFPFIVRSDFPSEEEQYVIYKKLVEQMPGKEITFRTLDIGGDKVLAYFDHHLKEKNPYLGMRSIRFSLKRTDIFAAQVRAILRAGHGRDIRIMFPMISSVDEFLQAEELVNACVESLNKEKTDCNQNPMIGLMVELPSTLEIIEDLAKEADFFSIGTNDFIQYMLAVDRTNEKVADLYLPYHPSILRALHKITAVALRHKKDVSVCGDMVHEKKYLEFLIGIGIRKFSMDPRFLPRIQAYIQEIKAKETALAVQEILTKTRLSDLKQYFSD